MEKEQDLFFHMRQQEEQCLLRVESHVLIHQRMHLQHYVGNQSCTLQFVLRTHRARAIAAITAVIATLLVIQICRTQAANTVNEKTFGQLERRVAWL